MHKKKGKCFGKDCVKDILWLYELDFRLNWIPASDNNKPTIKLSKKKFSSNIILVIGFFHKLCNPSELPTLLWVYGTILVVVGLMTELLLFFDLELFLFDFFIAVELEYDLWLLESIVTQTLIYYYIYYTYSI